MTISRGLLAAVALALAAGAAEAEPSAEDVLATALDTLAARSGTTRRFLAVDRGALELENSLAGLLPLTGYVMREPERAGDMVTALARALVEAPSLTARWDLLFRLYRPEATFAPSELPPAARAAPDDPHPLQAAMEELFAKTGERFQGKYLERVRRDESALDPIVARQTARLLMAALHAARERDAWVKDVGLGQGGVFEGKSKRTARDLRQALLGWSTLAPGLHALPPLERIPDPAALLALWGTGRDLTARVEAALDTLRSVSAPAAFRYEWYTPRGTVVVAGGGDDAHEKAAFLVLDLGGNDTYRGPGAVSGTSAVSLLLDLGGRDRYEPADSALAGPGGAILGVALVVDLGGEDDTYRGTGWSQGFGCLGLGTLYDEGGNDTYEESLFGQGAALLGAGMLVDGGGTDRYLLSAPLVGGGGFSQGYAGPLGLSLLLDVAGDDTYLVPDTAQGPAMTFVQGAAGGRRGAETGGLGLLIEGGGDDRLEGGSRSQGAGEAGGFGLLVNLAGHDTYRAPEAAEGYGAHVGAGLLVDAAGNDMYESKGSRTLGVGEDLGLGMARDDAGNDRFGAGESSLGASLGQGAGWFLDLGGNDVFLAPVHAMAVVDAEPALPWRASIPGVALFVDLGSRTAVNAPEGRGGVYPPRGTGRALGGAIFWPAPGLPEGTGP